jgi:ribosome-binding factor A
MTRIDKINSLLIKELANLVNKEIFLPECLITVSFVKCSSDLRHARVGFSVLPEKLSYTVLKKLQRSNKLFSQVLKKKLSLKHIPKLNWVIDARETNAAKIEEILKQINTR